MIMTRSLKRKLFIVVLCLFASTGFIVAYLIDTYVHSLKWMAIITFAFAGLIIAFSYFANKYKKSIVLTEEEKAMPLEKHLDFSNAFDWFGYVAFSVMIIIGEYCYMSYCSHPEAYALNVKLRMMLGIWVICTPLFFLRIRNKYIIEDDTLIIEEYDLFRKTTDLQIPIHSINKVTVNNIFTVAVQVVIEVDGVERVLRCTPHGEELAVALTRRIHTN